MFPLGPEVLRKGLTSLYTDLDFQDSVLTSVHCCRSLRRVCRATEGRVRDPDRAEEVPAPPRADGGGPGDP